MTKASEDRSVLTPEDAVLALTRQISNYSERLASKLRCPITELWALTLAATGRMAYTESSGPDPKLPTELGVRDGVIQHDGRTRYELWKSAVVEVLQILGDPEAFYRTGYDCAALLDAVNKFFGTADDADAGAEATAQEPGTPVQAMRSFEPPRKPIAVFLVTRFDPDPARPNLAQGVVSAWLDHSEAEKEVKRLSALALPGVRYFVEVTHLESTLGWLAPSVVDPADGGGFVRWRPGPVRIERLVSRTDGSIGAVIVMDAGNVVEVGFSTATRGGITVANPDQPIFDREDLEAADVRAVVAAVIAFSAVASHSSDKEA